MSKPFYRGPEVIHLLAEAKHGVNIAALEARLKGFGTEQFSLWRVQTRTPLSVHLANASGA